MECEHTLVYACEQALHFGEKSRKSSTRKEMRVRVLGECARSLTLYLPSIVGRRSVRHKSKSGLEL